MVINDVQPIWNSHGLCEGFVPANAWKTEKDHDEVQSQYRRFEQCTSHIHVTSVTAVLTFRVQEQ